ncbi:hypothetical protein Kpol_520p39 [Vanderwaltozyma polyspora DSM 70294]|uniref:ATP-dependent DNA helicase PIF1 n=1 Tax=Vanderwaltozyma polyspora (strain ATCC 22028 / DSM 70294 / BCRC 21397 / CBS 2163 / NBRC 10782 / NRRL Y-8283 / UCD 57-17) TaxID=436907 RepID=A7TMC2_VANPO|nr:uncharacterized protein Kpol_520p39 [Vanderwaltozyma polyspora DSM 70294]EDO16616.1 hypothetical protein Kpol_520p39 [Vanderwaltozyma polyspora DSM 70294]
MSQLSEKDSRFTPKSSSTPPKSSSSSPQIQLSEEQENIIELAKNGHNIFYTGSAGTGKSVLLRTLIDVMKSIHGPDRIAVTASTGLAACNIGGYTLHSFAGIGLGVGDVSSLINRVKRSKKHRDRWQTISVLIIDEISMIDSKLLDNLNLIAQNIRKNRSIFGGIQLIFCGDFFQLPPVSTNGITKYAFEAEFWKSTFDASINLKTVFRQKGDLKFIEMLNKLRTGKVDKETELEFKKLSRDLPVDDIIPAELYSTRNEVEGANYSRLLSLPGNSFSYKAIDGGHLKDEMLREKLLQNFLAPLDLRLKVGAQVMMIKNVDETLVNGSLGKVIAFIDHDTYAFYETIMNNSDYSSLVELEAYRDNINLLIQQSRKKIDDNNEMVRQKFSKEQFCKTEDETSTDDLRVNELDELFKTFTELCTKHDHNNNQYLDLKREILGLLLENSNGQRKLPLVNFKTANLTDRLVLVEPEDWAIEDDKEKALVSRVQLPLILAWSLSIHKSQGQTLPKLKVDLKRVFEKGHAYVALSRAVSRDGLQVLNFNVSKIKSHDKVVTFYSTLSTSEDALRKCCNPKEKMKPKITAFGVKSKTSSTYNSYSYSNRVEKNNSTRNKSSGGIIAMLQKRNLTSQKLKK